MDGPPAQSLGVEPSEANVMERPPSKGNIIPERNLIRIVIAGIVMTVGTLLLYVLQTNQWCKCLNCNNSCIHSFCNVPDIQRVQLQGQGHDSQQNITHSSCCIFPSPVKCYIHTIIYRASSEQQQFHTWIGLLIVVVASTIFLSEFISEKVIK